MAAAELEVLELVREDESERVRCWRYGELLRAGYSELDATEIAFDLEIDLHFAVGLVQRGCPSSTAARILL